MKQCQISKRINFKLSKELLTKTYKKSPKCQEIVSKSPDLKNLQKKYKKLEQKYMEILIKTKHTNLVYEKQEKSINRLKTIHDRDQKEIRRLKSMVNLTKREDIAIQTNFDDINIKTQSRKKYNENRQSITAYKNNRKDYPAQNLNFKTLKYTINNQLISTRIARENIINRLSNSPYSKYKFVSIFN